jgi:hypothetical protein
VLKKAVVLRTMPTSQNRDVGHPANGVTVIKEIKADKSGQRI